MNRIALLLLALACLLSACAAPGGKGSAKPLKPGQKITARTTAYTAHEPGGGGTKNALGMRLNFGGPNFSAAADWSWLPLGTRFRIAETGNTYVIEDYGSALVGRKTIDLYMPNRRMVNQWGVRQVQIEVVEWGSRIMSLKLLEPRQRNGHVRRMVSALRSGKDSSDRS